MNEEVKRQEQTIFKKGMLNLNLKKRNLSSKIIMLTQKIETKYGSVSKCPKNDPNYLKLLKITTTLKDTVEPVKQAETKKKNAKKFDAKTRSYAVSLAMMGYTNAEIGRLCKISPSTICNWTKILVGRPPLFNDEISFRNQPKKKIYFTGRSTIEIWCIKKGVSYQSLVTDTNPTFKLKRRATHWIDMPDGSFYTVPKRNGVYRKNNSNSFLEIHAIDPLIPGV
ncbi:hypothetical protein [uncultured Lactobacillus sp.]|uniref:hypothetical protein n=1 Tax=uncultured Lactobacillus sp. TaxID=153152 RepID=UPI002634D3EC|nr:hypothetical protein [uncultured Lactobacillus sp.]